MQLTIAGRSYELSETLESEQLAPIFDDAWTASRVWLASQYLSEHLVAFAETQEQPLLLKDGATVIELGSGCGLAGLVAASLGGNVLLTDQQQAVDLLVRNIDTNAAGASERSRLHATEFTWGTDPATCLPRSTYDYVLVSDCKCILVLLTVYMVCLSRGVPCCVRYQSDLRHRVVAQSRAQHCCFEPHQYRDVPLARGTRRRRSTRGLSSV